MNTARPLTWINAIIFVFALMIMQACKKESNGSLTTYEVITGSRWQLNKVLFESPPGDSPIDITSTTFKPCELDDIIEFKSDGTYSCTENMNICIPSNNSIFYYLNGASWSISPGDTVLTIGIGFNVQPFRFGNVNSAFLELKQTLKNYLGDDTRYTFVLKAIK